MKAGHGPHRADFERLAKHVMCIQLAISSTVPVVPQHCRSQHHMLFTALRKLHRASEGRPRRQPLPKVGIGTPNIRVDRFLRFAVRFRLVFFAFRFLAM
jgi:hypothetical protein